MKKFIFRHPILLLTLTGVAISFLAEKLGILYDSGGWQSIIFYLGMILQVCVNVAHEFVHSVPALKNANQGGLISLCLGIFLAVILDFTWVHMRKRAEQGKREAKKGPE